MIGMYTSRDALIGALGKKIRAIKAPGEKEIAEYFGRGAGIWVTSPYKTWDAYVFLDPTGLVIGVQDDHGRWLAKTDQLDQNRQTQFDVAIARTVQKYREFIAQGMWSRNVAISEINYQIQYAQRNRMMENANAWQRALEAF